MNIRSGNMIVVSKGTEIFYKKKSELFFLVTNSNKLYQLRLHLKVGHFFNDSTVLAKTSSDSRAFF